MKWNKKPSLDGVLDKIGRADVHRTQIKDKIHDWMRNHTYRLTPEVYGDGREHVYRVEYAPPLNPEWGLLLGDCVHNLRCALDHLACQLVIASGGVPNVSTQFPIWRSPSKLRADPKTGNMSAQPLDIRPRVARPILRVVESVQPYAGDQRIAPIIAAVHDLDNVDKHRQLIIVDMVAGSFTRGPHPYDITAHVLVTPQGEVIEIPDPRKLFNFRTFSGPLEKGKVVVKFFWDPPRPEPDPDFDIFPRPCMSKGLPYAPREVAQVVDELVLGIQNELIPRFTEFF